MVWEVKAALRKMKNETEAGKDQVNIETLKAEDNTIARHLATLYTQCITERRIPKTCKEANMPESKTGCQIFTQIYDAASFAYASYTL